MPATLFLALAFLAALAHTLAGQTVPTRVILLIGDGVGAGHWTTVAFAADDARFKSFRVMGLVDTRASNSDVTDSGAAATAYATGTRTYTGAIGVGPDTIPLPTVLEEAQERGMATGLVATSGITHATPAAFAAHVPLRWDQFEIARQMVEKELDVFLGGGRRWFEGTVRPDSVDLIERIREQAAFVSTAEELRELEAGSPRRVVGLFAEDGMPSAATRTPTLPEMTRAALQVLDHDPDGFFLMVEASQPDWLAGEPLSAMTLEMMDFDRTIGVAMDYQRRHPETLIVVVGDHEAGGLAVQLGRESSVLTEGADVLRETFATLADSRDLLEEERQAELDSLRQSIVRLSGELRADARGRDSLRLMAQYTTGGHTAELIPLFASGPGAERFGGFLENWQVGRLLLEVVRR
jgi:alkaline phosphatase